MDATGIQKGPRLARRFLARGAVVLLGLVASFPVSAETRGYVVTWFTTATNAKDFKLNCPEGRNEDFTHLLIRDLVASGLSKEEATKVVATANDTQQLGRDMMRKMEGRAIVNGKNVSVYNYPDAVPDPNVETVTGKFAYGFDLGLPNKSMKFIDPETKQPVDNQLWRAVGCLAAFQKDPPEAPYGEGRGGNGWAIQITGDDLSKDGKVAVTLDAIMQSLEVGLNGEELKEVSYTIDPTPGSHNVMQGEIKNGVLTLAAPSLEMEGSSYGEFSLRNVKMRVRSEGDKLVGYWGGLMDWQRYAYLYTSSPASTADNIGLYHAVKKMADANPDPKTGQNQEISATFRMEAIPAYLLDVDGKVLAKPAPQKIPS